MLVLLVENGRLGLRSWGGCGPLNAPCPGFFRCVCVCSCVCVCLSVCGCTLLEEARGWLWEHLSRHCIF